MIFKKASIPRPSVGHRITEKSQVLPDQSLTLQEILTRFVRHEALPVGHDYAYGSENMDPESDSPLNVDLEKLKFADLTEKDDYKAETHRVKEAYEEAEKRKADKAAKVAADKKAAEDEARIQAEVEKRAKGSPSPEGRI